MSDEQERKNPDMKEQIEPKMPASMGEGPQQGQYANQAAMGNGYGPQADTPPPYGSPQAAPPYGAYQNMPPEYAQQGYQAMHQEQHQNGGYSSAGKGNESQKGPHHHGQQNANWPPAVQNQGYHGQANYAQQGVQPMPQDPYMNAPPYPPVPNGNPMPNGAYQGQPYPNQAPPPWPYQVPNQGNPAPYPNYYYDPRMMGNPGYPANMPNPAYPARMPENNQAPHNGLSSFFDFRDERFLKGALVGAAVTFLLTNDSVQKNAIQSVVKVWHLFQGGLEEVKERFRDADAEIKAEDK
jgi:hypothetical protein